MLLWQLSRSYSDSFLITIYQPLNFCGKAKIYFPPYSSSTIRDMSARILILTNGPLCRNPRAWKEAQTLAESGMQVHVIGVRHRLDSEAYDIKLMQRARFTRAMVDYGASNLTQWKPLWRRIRRRIGGTLVAHLNLHSSWALPAAQSLLKAARAWPADLTIAHNEAPHWVGLHLIQEGRKVAADIEDWYSEDLLPEDNLRRPLRLIRRQEAALLQRAIYCTTPSHAMAHALHSRYGGTCPSVLTNSFPLQPNPLLRSMNSIPSFYWFSQTLGPGRGLEPFIKAWGMTHQPSRLTLQGECSPTFQADLLNLLPLHRRPDLEFLPFVSPDDLLPSIAKHDIGLALEQPFIRNRDLTITNKIIQYLNAGLAILASETQGQKEVLAQSPAVGSLINLEHPPILASWLDKWIQDRPALETRRRAARALAESTYCWEKEGPALVARACQALKSHA
jgi:glycosyltransferase involved in cell wall biosynthesis